jgi:hypothetical protein
LSSDTEQNHDSPHSGWPAFWHITRTIRAQQGRNNLHPKCLCKQVQKRYFHKHEARENCQYACVTLPCSLVSVRRSHWQRPVQFVQQQFLQVTHGEQQSLLTCQLKLQTSVLFRALRGRRCHRNVVTQVFTSLLEIYNLRHYATNRKVVGSNLNVIEMFNWPHPSSRTMSLGFTQPLTEMNTRNLLGGKEMSARKA